MAGDGLVLGIDSCPPSAHGLGRIVTGVFRHWRGETLDLSVEGEPVPIVVTKEHPFWSADRGGWVPACELQRGERLLAEGGAMPRVLGFEPRPGDEPVYNIEVEGDHCYRIGFGGLLVHNSSCPSQTTYKSLGRESISVSWTLGAVFRSTGIAATIVPGSVAGPDFPPKFPTWWSDFLKSTTDPLGSRWRRGHLLAAQFGGPPVDYNFAPMYFLVNNSAFAACEKRIKSALECDDCVKLRVEVSYDGRVIVPSSFRYVVESPSASIDAVIQNVPSPVVPRDCQI